MIAAIVTSSLASYRNANGWPGRFSPDLDVHALIRPPETGVKLYFDAGMSLNAIGIGIATIGEDGEFLRARERKYSRVTDVALAECMALEDVVDLAREMNVNQPVFIGDALGVVRMARGDEIAPLTCSDQVARIQSLLATHEFSPPFRMNRENNLLAHSLVAHAKAGVIDSLDWTSMPSFFLSFDTGRIPVV